MPQSGTIIIGGGVIGLALGWRLAQGGERVTVLERRRVGRQASWAAAGMLNPAAELESTHPELLKLTWESLALYPAFVRELETLSGQSVDYRAEGTLQIALTHDDAETLRDHYELLHERLPKHRLPVEWLDGDAVRAREPNLSSYVTAGIFCPQDHQLDNRKLLRALQRAARQAGCRIVENCAVEQVVIEGERCTGVYADGEYWHSQRSILAAGSWSGQMRGLPAGIRPPVRPVKGQIMALQMPTLPTLSASTPPVLTHVVRTRKIYLAPKRDGRLILGGSVEEKGFDANLTAGEIYRILRGGWEMLPATYEMPILDMWCGFRPGSRDNLPLLGESGVRGLFMATGHYRHGFLLAPATAEHLPRHILGAPLPAALEPFSPRRFDERPLQLATRGPSGRR